MAQLYFYYSAMDAGKSTVLLQSAHNYKERGMAVALYTAAIDDRVAVGQISSRIGLQSDAHLYDDQTDLFRSVQRQHDDQTLACVLVDEAQFLTEAQVWQLSDIVDELNIPVLCFGLRTDFQGKLFPGSEVLLAIAEKLTELKTVCHCGRKATMVIRLDANGRAVTQGSQVEIGGNDRYESVCRQHYKAATRA
ncbi:MAG: thymidine kinase [Gammaproteobacteria bacterium]|nr:thymidine kinase [Gammaproteobacteria bacterium]